MRRILLLLFAMLPFALYAQIEETKEVQMSKDELFTKTKMFITDKWNNPKWSIQNEDKDGGIIQVKTEKEFSINVGMGLKCVYNYEYLTKFRFKDNKYKVEFYDIRCLSAKQIGLGTEHDIPLIPYFTGENAPDTKSLGKGISKKKAIVMMQDLDKEFSEIMNQYNKYINTNDDF